MAKISASISELQRGDYPVSDLAVPGSTLSVAADPNLCQFEMARRGSSPDAVLTAIDAQKLLEKLQKGEKSLI